MRFIEFETRARPLLAFNLNDVRKIDPGYHRQQLSDWLGRGFIKPLTGGYYRLVDQGMMEDGSRVAKPIT